MRIGSSDNIIVAAISHFRIPVALVCNTHSRIWYIPVYFFQWWIWGEGERNYYRSSVIRRWMVCGCDWELSSKSAWNWICQWRQDNSTYRKCKELNEVEGKYTGFALVVLRWGHITIPSLCILCILWNVLEFASPPQCVHAACWQSESSGRGFVHHYFLL